MTSDLLKSSKLITKDDVSTPLYLDDLQRGRRFISEAHALDEKQIINFANQFDP
jgi:hypothetical protein